MVAEVEEIRSWNHSRKRNKNRVPATKSAAGLRMGVQFGFLDGPPPFPIV